MISPSKPLSARKGVINMDPAIEKVQEKMDWLSADDDTYRKYLSLEKARLDYNSGMNWARKEGELDAARRMKLDNMPLALISKYTGLPEKDISQL
jgi:hypothetical protein